MITDLGVKYYYLINDDLKMSKGKIAAQVSHVAMMLGKQHDTIGRAVVLKAPEKILRECIKIFEDDCKYIIDAGLTEVPQGSLTCVGFRQGQNSEIMVEHLKLL
jgi:peptidyl-tRNA hydrolase